MISIIISKIPLHVYLLICLGRDVNSEMHLFYKLCTLQYGRPQQPLHTINPHPIHTPWNICPMVNVIPHVVGQTVPVSFYSIYPVPKKPLGECVKSGSTPVGGPVKSRRRWTKEEGRGLDKRLVWLELVTAWIQRLRTTSIDLLHRFRSR